MHVRIYRPARTAMQSGRAKTRNWLLEFEPTERASPDPLMGWCGSADTNRQVRLGFANKADAVAYAERRGWSYTLGTERKRRIRPKSYADNFAYGRPQPWTH